MIKVEKNYLTIKEAISFLNFHGVERTPRCLAMACQNGRLKRAKLMETQTGQKYWKIPKKSIISTFLL